MSTDALDLSDARSVIAMARDQARSHPSCGSEVYLDRFQCAVFDAPYMAKGRDDGKAPAVCLTASTLLESKDYDSVHKDLLAPLGNSDIVLARRSDQSPGWFTITSVYPDA